MKNTYIAVLILIVLIVGAVFIFGTGKQASAPLPDTNALPNEDTDQVVCTMEAKLCPDGSYVGRSGPKCEFAACPGASNAAPAAVKEFTITGKNFAFTPSTITVKQGDKVKITFNNINGFHNFAIDEYGIATLQKQSPDTEVLEFTADKAGSFEYYCAVGSHRAMGMKGTLIVE